MILLRLANGRSSEQVLAAIARCVYTLPTQLCRSLAWDQGKEMAGDAGFTIDTGLRVFFCAPRSPWQRGTNENTNGLLRQYFPKYTDLGGISQRRLDAVAAELNGRPRQTLGWLSPSERFAELVAMTPLYLSARVAFGELRGWDGTDRDPLGPEARLSARSSHPLRRA